MGNTVSAADTIAFGITHTKNDTEKPPQHHKSMGTPPPGCPMHQKETQPPQTAATECPIDRPNDNSDINPYNMVSFFVLSIAKLCRLELLIVAIYFNLFDL